MTWFRRQPDSASLFVTAITVAEVLYGVELLPAGKRRNKLQAEADAIFAHDFSGRILNFDEESARAFAQIAAGCRTQGHPVAELDAQIAAIAQVHNADLATRNTGDFEGCGLRLINPWSV
jgi:toxin FitB